LVLLFHALPVGQGIIVPDNQSRSQTRADQHTSIIVQTAPQHAAVSVAVASDVAACQSTRNLCQHPKYQLCCCPGNTLPEPLILFEVLECDHDREGEPCHQDQYDSYIGTHCTSGTLVFPA
jgi:hypothetical protein